MIRAVAKGRKGRTLLVLGLERENTRLTQGKLIVVEGDAFGLDLPVDVIIMFHETIEQAVAELRAAGIEPRETLDFRGPAKREGK